MWNVVTEGVAKFCKEMGKRHIREVLPEEAMFKMDLEG